MNELIDLRSMRFGSLTVLEKMMPQKDGKTRWLCQCDCGNLCVVNSYALRKGLQKSCGCRKKKDITGQRFGKLTALEISDKTVTYPGRGVKRMWKCVCDCGNVVYRLPEKLRNGVDSACEICAKNTAVCAMTRNAGFTEGTQLKKIASNKPLATNKSGVRGVFYNKRTGKWRAMIKFQGKDHYLGEYKDIREAAKARARAEELYFAPILEKYGMK